METASSITKEGTFSKLRNPEEELAYLRERVRSKERELELERDRFDSDRIAKREIVNYGNAPSKEILHETTIVPEHDATRIALELEPEEHDKQIDGLLKIISERGIKNALTIAAKVGNEHIEDDLHRALVRYIAEGLPLKESGTSKEVWKALHMALFEIQPQATSEGDENKTLEQILSSMEQLYSGLFSMIDTNTSLCLELAVPEGTEEAILYIAVPSNKKSLLERHVFAVFPHARLEEVRGDYNIFNHGGEHTGAVANFTDHASLPIKNYKEFEHDPMNVLLSAFSKLKKHSEGAAIQIVIGDVGERYNKHFQKILGQVKKGESLKKAQKIPETAFGDIASDLGKTIFNLNSTKDENKEKDEPDNDALEILLEKNASSIVPVSIRAVASASDSSRAEEILEYVTSTFRQFDNSKGNRIKFTSLRGKSLQKLFHSFTFRLPDSSNILPLNLAELTTIFHFTAQGVSTSRELKQSRAKSAPAPVSMASDGIILGINKYGSSETEVRFSPEDRLRHFYEIGQTGTGKTVLMKNMIIQDIQNGEGVCYIDPHGSDIEDLLAAIPPEREGDVIYFDPARTDRVIGLNMLEYDIEKPELKTLVADEIYGIFRKLYADNPEGFGPMFEQYYRNSAMLVMEDPSTGNTFVEVSKVLTDTEFRNLKLSRCKNPLVVQFWEKIATQVEGEASLANIAPYITSKFDVFLANDIMRPIISQEKSAFDFRDVMDNKKILLVNLSKGRLGDRNSNLLGLIIVGKFLQAALSRSDSREDLPPFYLYIDEFHNFTTPAISTIFSEARKYKLSLNVAHQYIAQLSEDIRESVFGNVGTRCAFRVGTDDAEFLAKTFSPTFTAQDLENIQNFHAHLSLLVNGTPATPFDIRPLPPKKYDGARAQEIIELSYRTHGRPRAEVEAEISKKFQNI